MPESILLDITTVIVLGIGAQWLAWRFRLPSILLLLLAGFLAGPVLGLLSPASLQGDWLFAFVSVSIGIILFEGGLSLRLSELQAVGSAVRNLISIGVFITWGLAAFFAHIVMGFNVELSILIGAILTVTGPTVVVPLLRHVRPRGRVSTVAKWEGITIDPVGAIIAVLVMETLLLIHEPAQSGGHTGLSTAAEHVVIGLGLEIFVALGVSVAATFLLLIILKQRLVPDFLRNPVTLMIVVAAFVISNVLKEESGLLTTTIMGIALANQPYAPVQRIIEFKENLQVLLIGSLFILLSARLDLGALEFITIESLIFLGLLVILVRPLAVFLSTFNTQLEWEEQAFLAWLAPRGIVAAAVASLFAYQLRNIYPDQVEAVVPTVFFVIVGTVAIYGLTAAPLARWLGIAEPNPEGLLFVGAAEWVRHVAAFLHEHGHEVHLVDANADHVRRAQEADLPARRANALSETVLDDLDLSSTGRLLITIPNDEVASLTALHFSEVFETTDIYQLAAEHESRHSKEGEMPKHLRGRPLFGEMTSYADIEDQFNQGGTIRAFDLQKDGGLFDDGGKEYYTYEDLQEQTGDISVIPFFILRGSDLVIVSEESNFSLRRGDTLIAMVGASERVHLVEEGDSSVFFFQDPDAEPSAPEPATETPTQEEKESTSS
ncbi:cation:proton antiporter [Longibacter salinarum]|uniref:Cation:proton antiporter n=1 Tax=Longibacter salinarum TaxID=1850348 RepID=A0A2A8CWF1_9BACT|nr:sodium:proton antiporter [Longibacter salinarum]PEN13022.1 cation:proton antiporter [Longibacter salinarum]